MSKETHLLGRHDGRRLLAFSDQRRSHAGLAAPLAAQTYNPEEGKLLFRQAG